MTEHLSTLTHLTVEQSTTDAAGSVNEYFKYTMMVLNPMSLLCALVVGNILPYIPFLGLISEGQEGKYNNSGSVPSANGIYRNYKASGYAFSIWPVIYTLLAGFTVYQAIPAEWLSGFLVKNDDLIFNQINVIFVINMAANGTWFVFRGLNNEIGQWIKLLLILAMLATGLYIQVVSNRASVNWFEFITIRLGVSIYSGWLLAATYLQADGLISYYGMGPLWGFSYETIGVIFAWIALSIYTVISYVDRNPIFGFAFTWAMTAILVDIKTKRPSLENFFLHGTIIDIINTISMLCLTTYLVFETLQDDLWKFYKPLEFYQHGIIYAVTWPWTDNSVAVKV